MWRAYVKVVFPRCEQSLQSVHNMAFILSLTVNNCSLFPLYKYSQYTKKSLLRVGRDSMFIVDAFIQIQWLDRYKRSLGPKVESYRVEIRFNPRVGMLLSPDSGCHNILTHMNIQYNTCNVTYYIPTRPDFHNIRHLQHQSNSSRA